MSTVERQVRIARRRLLTNVLAEQAAWALLVAAAAWGLFVVVQRALSLEIPVAVGLSAAGLLAVVGTALLTWRHAVGRLEAAVAIDAAAGLKERVSTALAVAGSGDPFAAAAVRDAEKVAAGVRVPAHIRYRAPQLWPWTTAVTLAAVLTHFLMPELNLLASAPKDQRPGDDEAAHVRQEITAAVDQQLQRVQQRVEENPSLAGLAEQLRELEIPESPTATPEDVRREAVKRIDNVSDRLREKLDTDQLRSLDEMKRQLARLEAPQGNDPASKLAADLSRGDLNSAQKRLEELKKQIQELADNADPEAAKQLADLAEKLESLSKQLEQLNDEQRLQKELENKAGLSEEQAKELLEKMAQMDPKQFEKELQNALAESGMTPEQIQQMAEKMLQSQQARESMLQMAQSLAQAASACQNAGDGDAAAQAMAALGAAAGQLSALEMADQLMQELQVQLAELDRLKQGACQGDGLGPPDGGDEIGQQGPQYGRGYGSRIGSERVAHQYQATRIQGQSQGGEIIGQMLVDAPMVRGEARTEVFDAVRSAVRDATDAIEREEVPRQYERTLRLYFERLAGLVDRGQKPADDGADEPAEASEE